MATTLTREARRLWSYRWQIWIDMVKDLVSDSRETAGRVFWIIALPLVPMGLYLFLSKLRVFPPHESIQGVPYVMVGAALWFLFSGLFTGPVSALRRKGGLAAQTRYPLFGVVLSSALHTLVEFAIRAIFAAVVLAFTQWPNPLGAAGLLLVIAPLGLVFLGAGTILAVFSVAWKDVEKATGIVVQYLFFFSNVLFTLPESVIPRWLIWCNPFAFAIDTCRWYLMFGSFPNVWLWLGWSVFGVILLLKALHFVSVSEARLSAHL